ncbi:MAG TPA: hypothetical protein VFS31_08415, partial [Chitinophagaceae bacterium]|nr:hypothetical protein [Chitinophagaceae bacterium]
IEYRSHGSGTLIYVTDEAATAGKVKVRVRDGDKDYTLKELPAGSSYLLDLAQFNGHWYMAAGDVAEGKVSIYKDPVTTLRKTPITTALPISTLRVKNPEFVSFSQNARFVMVQGGSNFAVYDAERDRQYRYDTKLALTPAQKAVWMDGHRISLIANGKATVFDFDGTNMQTLMAADPAFPIIFDRDYEAMYALAPSATTTGTTDLTRTELIVK